MMQYTELSLCNWGPFLGDQRIDLTVEGSRNVIIVYGENGTGKSHLFRALHFALYGEVQEGDDVLALSTLVNDLAVESFKNFETNVSLSVSGDTDFTVHRQLKCEVEDNLLLIKDEASSLREEDSPPLSSAIMRDFIERRFPQAVSKFFLFDAELIRKFEEELRMTNGGGLIRRNIRDILGVPAFTNVATALERIERNAAKALATSRSKSDKENKAWAEIAKIQAQIEEVDSDIKIMTDEIRSLESDIRDLDSELARYADQEKALGKLEARESERDTKVGSRDEYRSQLTDLTRELWFSPVANLVSRFVHALEAERDEITSNIRQSVRREVISELRQQGAESGTCPVCDQVWERSIDETADSPSVEMNALDDRVQDIVGLTKSLRFVSDASPRIERLHDLVAEISTVQLDIMALGNQIADLKVVIGDRGDHISVLNARKEEKVTERTQYEGTLVLAKQDRDEKSLAVKTLRQKMPTSPDAGIEQTRENLARHLGEIFDNAVEEFEDEMRIRVQEESSEVFRRLISSSELTDIRINQDFRISALDKNGNESPRLSSGQQQVRALALLAGLFECGVKSAPLVMDTPFARLDVTHIGNILQWIRGLERQVVLLVQSNEFNIQRDRPILEDVIAREYTLRPTRLKETVIEEGMPSTTRGRWS